MTGPRTTGEDYAQGMADGLAGLGPQFERLALGANRLNAYERGYIDSGRAGGNDEPGSGERPEVES